MIISCDKETMPGEGRVALMPQNVKELADNGTELLVVKSAGVKSGFSNRAYKQAGSTLTSHASAWKQADFIVKVKQPLREEFKYFRSGLMIACFGHLSANLPLLECLLNTGVTLIDYGTIQRADGSLHVLAKMSELAGEIAVWDGVKLLKQRKKIILRPETSAAIIGMGNAGLSAARLIVPTGATLYCFDKNRKALERAQGLLRESSYQVSRLHKFSLYQQVQYLKYDQNDPRDQEHLAAILKHVNLLIGCTQEYAKGTGKPVPEWVMENMQNNSAAIDISIDQGGCFETSSRFFKTEEQIFKEHDVWHYCVPNMPGKIPHISTPILCRETFPHIKETAQKGLARAVLENPALAKGVVTHKGWITCVALAEDESVDRMDRYKSIYELLR